jgi:hypothetical protein
MKSCHVFQIGFWKVSGTLVADAQAQSLLDGRSPIGQLFALSILAAAMEYLGMF